MPIMKISEINIEKMTKDDVETVVKIEEEAYGKHHWAKSSFYDEMSNNLAKYYVAKLPEGEIVGYAGTWHIIDDCYKNNIKYLTLEVRVSNLPAIKLYEKYGFQSLGTRKGYYQDNSEDALIMWTENIFYEKFKTLYQQNCKQLENIIKINE